MNTMQVLAVPHRLRTHLAAWIVIACSALLTACSTQPPRTIASDTNTNALAWSGRLGLQVHDPLSAEKTFSATFHLQGTPEAGNLDIFNPFGSQVAQLQWQPGTALLIQGAQRTYSESLSALLQQSLGTELPIQALFGWLQGQPAQAVGWQVDLSRHAQGRITAQRLSPPPQATLRIVLQQPE